MTKYFKSTHFVFMWSDNETNIDYLNYTELAELICDMVTDDTLFPLSVGVYGGWGAGKSSVLRLVEETLSAQEDTIVVEFDAWLYQGYDEAKSALMTVIASKLMTTAPQSLKDKAIGLVKRTNKLRLLGLGLDAGLMAAGVPSFGLATKGLESLGKVFNGDADQEDSANIKAALTDVKQRADGLIAPKEIKSAPEEIAAFKEEFSDLLRSMNKRLVVFVDNLDRCLPENAIKSLEAMRLFLSMQNTAFIVAADVDIIRHAVSTHFKGASPRHVIDYLDKLIQFPVAVPKLGMREVLAFLCMLIASRSGADGEAIEKLRCYLIKNIQDSWQDTQKIERKDVLAILEVSDADLSAQIDTAFRIAPILAHSTAVSGNPRLIKRMMNIVRMRYATAKRRKMELDEVIITKLALFERCTDEAAFKQLLTIINDAGNGKPSLFAKDSDERTKLPEAMEKYRSFFDEWIDLEPSLNGIDLRPAIYLARETLPLQIQSKALSAVSVNVVKELLKIPSLTSKAAMTEIGKIPQEEVSEVMQELVVSLRQNSDWSKKRNDINGPILLASKRPECATILLSFTNQISNPAPWLEQVLKGIQN
ncbi:KAP family P-loop NTPase fold protein [Brucella oryzae]|uniref:KAP family P-loop NTPase fold protein n=1 Tax=Brucella oryzae TaxID=335286 RepID=UPI0035BC93E7